MRYMKPDNELSKDVSTALRKHIADKADEALKVTKFEEAKSGNENTADIIWVDESTEERIHSKTSVPHNPHR